MLCWNWIENFLQIQTTKIFCISLVYFNLIIILLKKQLLFSTEKISRKSAKGENKSRQIENWEWHWHCFSRPGFSNSSHQSSLTFENPSRFHRFSFPKPPNHCLWVVTPKIADSPCSYPQIISEVVTFDRSLNWTFVLFGSPLFEHFASP